MKTFGELFENGPRIIDRRKENGAREFGIRHKDGREEWGMSKPEANLAYFKATKPNREKATKEFWSSVKPFRDADPTKRPHNK